MRARTVVVILLVVAVALLAVAFAGRVRGDRPGPSVGTTASPSRSASPAPSASPTTTPTAIATPVVLATGDPRLLYAEFLLRVNDDRSKVASLNATLSAAVNVPDLPAAKRASVAILDFVDSERDWLREHPPAACYQAAHASATTMLAAYGTAADRFIDWTATAPGLDRLAALGVAAQAAGVAGDDLTAFGQTLQSTRCPS